MDKTCSISALEAQSKPVPSADSSWRTLGSGLHLTAMIKKHSVSWAGFRVRVGGVDASKGRYGGWTYHKRA